MKHEDEKYTLEINYDKKSRKEGLIKLTPKTEGEIILESDALLAMISTYMKKDIAITLSEVDRKEIWMMLVERILAFTADRDYKQGEQVAIKVSQPYPAVLYALEKEFGLCKQSENDKSFYAITQEDVANQLESIKEENRDFINHWGRLQTNGKDLEELKKTESDRLEKEEN